MERRRLNIEDQENHIRSLQEKVNIICSEYRFYDRIDIEKDELRQAITNVVDAKAKLKRMKGES